ncbi:Ltp family lipoprotein [Levilactobacillus senmaizukei]|uniref:Ltp family lipoprotein n=1 Tax=Levilactobacillus senmaizukei TaxID=431273 RepID=UPI0009E6D1A7|nr:Ltp family lipoprotein [Levilactobacillus senmaizukei]
MKKHLIVGIIALLILPLSACGVGAHAAEVDGHAIYAVDVQTSKATDDDGDWTVHGTTKAPDNAKIIVTNADEDDDFFGDLGGEAANNPASWATVHDGKFSVNIDPISVAYKSKYRAGDQCKVQLFAITDYHEPWTNSTIAKKIATKAVDKFDSTTLTLTSSQAEYFNGLDSDNDDDEDQDSSTATTADSSDSDEPNAESESTSDDVAETTSSSSKISTEYTSALSKAEIYATEMDMSKASLYDQLTSASGEQFSAAAADYAISHLKGVSWNANALAKAKSYQNDMAMAPAAIRDQLTSSAGEQFTQAQADYALSHLS